MAVLYLNVLLWIEWMGVDLSNYNNDGYKTGRGFFIRFLWYFVNALFVNNPLNFSSTIKIVLMRLFGAKIGRGVVMKPAVVPENWTMC
jgi:putative colanic acid biosynthesis acetyltransferase WcaF